MTSNSKENFKTLTMFPNNHKETTQFPNTMTYADINATSTQSENETEFPSDISGYLADLNQEFTDLVLPAIVYLAILMIIGIVGNTLVLYVYTYKTRTGTITRYIQALAVFDLLSCCLAMPGEIADMSQNYTFGKNPVCKVVRTVNLFCTMASGVTLVVVAVDRHKRICSPLNDQISPRTAYIIVVICTCVCGVLSLPSAAIFGSRTVSTRWRFVNGTDCSISDRFINTAVPLAYNSFQMLLFLVGAVVITVLYYFVGRTIFRQAHRRKVRARRRSSVFIQPIDGHVSSLPVSDPSSHSSQELSSPEPVVIDKNVFLTSNVEKKKWSQKFDSNSCKTKRLYVPNRQNGNIRHSNSSKFVEIELSSATTVSPPETPIDQQYFDYRPLIKLPQSKSTSKHNQKNDGKQHKDSNQNDKKVGASQRLEQVDEQTMDDSRISKSFEANVENKQAAHENVTINIEDEIISGNLKESRCDKNFETINPSHNSCAEKCCVSSEKCRNTNESNDELSKRYSAISNVNDSKMASTVDCHNCKNKYIQRLKPALNHVDGDSGYGDTGSQEKLRWSTAIMTSQPAGAFPDRKQVLFRSNSDIGRRQKAGEDGKEATKRAVTSDDEGNNNSLRRLKKKNGEANGRMRRHSSFKRFRELKKLSISDPQGTRRTTLMLFLISLIYVLSFLPHLILMIIKVTHPTSLSGEGGSLEVAHNILLRSYFINSVANPIIYSFCSRDFVTRCLGHR